MMRGPSFAAHQSNWLSSKKKKVRGGIFLILASLVLGITSFFATYPASNVTMYLLVAVMQVAVVQVEEQEVSNLYNKIQIAASVLVCAGCFSLMPRAKDVSFMIAFLCVMVGLQAGVAVLSLVDVLASRKIVQARPLLHGDA